LPLRTAGDRTENSGLAVRRSTFRAGAGDRDGLRRQAEVPADDQSGQRDAGRQPVPIFVATRPRPSRGLLLVEQREVLV